MIRTTVAIDDVLFDRLRQRAAKRRQTLAEMLNEILAEHFRPQKSRAPYRLEWEVIDGDRSPAVDPADRDHLYQFLDEHS